MKNKFKKIFAVVLTACIMLTACPLGSLNITASATTGTATSGDYTYIYHKGVAIITGIDWSVSGDVVIPSSLGGYPVQTIGASAFYDCVNITSVTIPYDVIEIDYHAFQNSGIQKIFIPSSVSKINEGAFDGCNDLRAVWYGQSEENKNMNLWISESGNDSLLSSEWHYDACDINSNQSVEHYYYSDCDSLCRNCGWVREPLSEHVYTEDCDEYCNLCNEHTYRAVGHIYSGTCDEICNKCNTVRYIYKPNHSYNTQCDKECDVCGYVRAEEEMHLYDGLCDTECNLCKTQRKTTVEHAFISDCDEECNICYFVRSALIQHQYENNCDESCDICGHMRSVGDHVYDNDCDTECNECKFQREITHNYEWIIDKENDCGNDGVKHEECSICHTTRNGNTVIEATGLHNYDNTCDTQCNTCGQIREIVHDFEWIIDKGSDCGNDGVKHEECSICHTTRNENTVINATGIHVYDNKCDTVCNVCYHVRTIEHTYNNACDKECNICQYIRDVGEHNYTLNSGFTCSICKYSKKPNAPQLLSVTATNIYWQGYEGFEYIVEGHQNYWQSYNYISGLIPNTEYTIYQRVAQSNTGNVSEISDPLKVKTLIGYTVTYNANGGENAPYSEIRAEGETFALSSQRPTRSGYQFYGWATSKYGSVVYKAGDECTIKSDVTLYAKWRKICEGCHGTGEKYNISSCIQCDGDGEDWGFRECKSCLGSGTRFNGSIIVCDTCNGLGSETYRYVCSKCSGVGKIYGYVTCSSCEGKRTFSEFEEAVITEFPKKILIAENGAVLSISGGEIILYYCDGLSETQNIFNSMISGYDKTFAGIQEIVIDYYGKTAICQVEVKFVQKNIPSAPVVSSFTDTTVTLINFEGCEYSKDGKNWQSSNIFNNLSPATAYAFYQRYVETDTYSYGNKSTGTSVTTDKSKQTLVPDVPTVQSFTTSRITLNMVEGCEYSKDGITWYESNVFSGLSCGTEYTFYQRYKETTITYVGKSSAALVARTDKGTQTAPSAPTLENKTHNSVTLTKISGCEYSRDGINWQTSNVFTGLTPETNYMFYQRKAENDRYYVSSSSSALIVKTNEQPEYTLYDYTIEFKDWDGTVLSSGIYNWGDEIIIPANPTRKSDNTYTYTFAGWDKTVVNCAGNTTYTATYTPNYIDYTVVFKNYDGTVLSSKTYHYGDIITVPNTPIKPADDEYTYKFAGWDSSVIACNGNKTYIATFEIEAIKKHGWYLDESEWVYYINGEKATGWQYINYNWYYFNSSGAMQTGWQYIGNTWYYMNEGGAMQTGWLQLGNTWYYLGDGGAMVDGWQYISNTWYYFSGGAMQTGWLNQGGAWYYLADGGNMVTGWQYVGSSWYYFNNGGNMATGWLLLGNTWYYLASGGNMLTDWQYIDGNWYYFYNSGAMAANCWIGNYWINANGVWI